MKAGAQAMLQVRAGQDGRAPQQSQFVSVYWGNVIIKLGDLLMHE